MNFDLQVFYMLIFSVMVGIGASYFYPEADFFTPDIILIWCLVVFIDFIWLTIVVYL